MPLRNFWLIMLMGDNYDFLLHVWFIDALAYYVIIIQMLPLQHLFY